MLFRSMFLTAKDTENDMVYGLNIGADDYISKPYSIREVVARIKAILRRRNIIGNQPNLVTYRDLKMDLSKKKTYISDSEISLTKKEFEILKLLLNNQGQVFSREEILSKIWTDEVYVLDRTIDVNITRLRKKIGEYPQPEKKGSSPSSEAETDMMEVNLQEEHDKHLLAEPIIRVQPPSPVPPGANDSDSKIGRASCRERVSSHG